MQPRTVSDTVNVAAYGSGRLEQLHSQDEVSALHEEIRALAREKGAVILAHNYQVPEVQDVAEILAAQLEEPDRGPG